MLPISSKWHTDGNMIGIKNICLLRMVRLVSVLLGAEKRKDGFILSYARQRLSEWGTNNGLNNFKRCIRVWKLLVSYTILFLACYNIFGRAVIPLPLYLILHHLCLRWVCGMIGVILYMEPTWQRDNEWNETKYWTNYKHAMIKGILSQNVTGTSFGTHMRQ